MSKLPNSDPSNSKRNRYHVIRELGKHPKGSIVTYLARDNTTSQEVVLKRFLLGEWGLKPSDFQEFQSQMQKLCHLNHAGIPPYLNCFQTPDSFCVVRQYQKGKSLAEYPYFQPEEIKQIAIAVLEILVYLQQQNNAIVHANIKPTNILVDDTLKVYLVDFSLTPKLTDTSAWLAPEQQHSRIVTEVTDHYRLSKTLLWLVTGQQSTNFNHLIDRQGKINLDRLVFPISPEWIKWLEKMLHTSLNKRYYKAVVALEALKPIVPISLPEVKYTSSTLEFKANKLNEKITQSITISNPNIETILQGNWSVANTHKDSQRSTNYHPWISFYPAKFQRNHVVCKITVDTSKLMADRTYERQLVLQTNSSPQNHYFTIKVTTASLPTLNPPLISLCVLFVTSIISGLASAALIGNGGTINWLILIFGLGIGSVGGGAATVNSLDLLKKIIGLIVVISGVVAFLPVMGADVDITVGFFLGLIVSAGVGVVVKNHLARNFSLKLALIISIFTAGLGMILGTEYIDGMLPFITLALLGTGIPLAVALGRLTWQNKTLMDNYRKNERYLIKP